MVILLFTLKISPRLLRSVFETWLGHSVSFLVMIRNSEYLSLPRSRIAEECQPELMQERFSQSRHSTHAVISFASCVIELFPYAELTDPFCLQFSQSQRHSNR